MWLSLTPFPCFNLCTSFSLFPSPPFFLLLWPLPQSCQQGTHRQSIQRSSPNMFLVLPFVESISIIFIICHFYLVLTASFTGSLPFAAEVALPFIFFFIFDMKTRKSVYLPWLLLTWPPVHLLSCRPPTRHPNTYPLFAYTHPQTHIISHINTVPKNTDAIELLSMPSCIVCQ